MNEARCIGYVRVSRDNREVQNQRLEILEFARKEQLLVNEFIAITVSTRKKQKQRRIEELCEKLLKGDLLVVSELSRLGRSMGELVLLLERLTEQGVFLVSLREGIDTRRRHDLATKCIVFTSGLFAEIERDLISERVKAGLARARSQGKVLGRPKNALKSRLDPKREEIFMLRDKGVNTTNLARIFDVSRATMAHFLETRDKSSESGA